jgi:two-component system cell cycle response regulator
VTDPGDRGRPTLPEAFDASVLFPKNKDGRPVLVVLTGPQVGQRIQLEQVAIIGRDPEADLMLTDESVDWHHARVEPRPEGWAVVDLTGQRRTEVNGMRVHDLLLSADDQIILGGTVVRFEVHDPVEQAYDKAVLERINKDDLTGLLARRRFDIELMMACHAARRKSEPIAVLVLDIDGLKQVNDRHGHLVGARVISEVGRVLGGVVGHRGMACRLGGDEFGIALVGLDGEDGVAIANAVRDAVACHAFTHEGERLRVHLSGGVAVLPTHGIEPVELLRAADEALYRAKRGGGDRIELR